MPSRERLLIRSALTEVVELRTVSVTDREDSSALYSLPGAEVALSIAAWDNSVVYFLDDLAPTGSSESGCSGGRSSSPASRGLRAEEMKLEASLPHVWAGSPTGAD